MGDEEAIQRARDRQLEEYLNRKTEDELREDKEQKEQEMEQILDEMRGN